ncbi:cupin domain-containing protein [Sorangium sp. So ce185]|uniref:cupin domain-containing protein n=1 Tax=Sorangium sp. So ce185 TaxID=3133287 RepID=UPI003F5D5D9A
MTKSGPVIASDVPPRAKPSNYPEPFASRVAGRQKQPLGDVFGLRSFGVNRTTLKPGAMSALRHWHSVQDELIYILSGHPTLITDAGETTLDPGMCMGFKGGDPDGHHLVNRSSEDVVYLEIGDRLPGDSGSYPDDDLKAVMGADGKWQFQRKDGTPY